MHKTIRVLLIICSAAFVIASENINFDTMAPDKVPAGWTISMTHKGSAPKWIVIREQTAPSQPNVLAQTSDDATSSRFPLAIYNAIDSVDGVVRVKFKAISGKKDQAAGIVWRYRDPDNYYIARANALENNVVLYKVENGKRTALAPKATPPNTYGVNHLVPSGTWCELSVQFHGNLFCVSFNGEKLFEVEDLTFREAGKVGLWTKADSVTYFDDFSVESK